jgi:hypothetical protein
LAETERFAMPSIYQGIKAFVTKLQKVEWMHHR